MFDDKKKTLVYTILRKRLQRMDRNQPNKINKSNWINIQTYTISY